MDVPRFSEVLKRETQIGLHGQALNISAYRQAEADEEVKVKRRIQSSG